MFSPDTTSSYGTLGILPTNVNSNIHHPHHDYNHHDRGNINLHIPSYHRPNRHTYSSPLNVQKHSQGRYTSSDYIAISSSSISTSPNLYSNQSSLQSHSTTTTQGQHIPHSTSTAAPVSSHSLSLSTTEFEGVSWNTARRHSELLQQQQLLYHDLSEFLARTATTTSKTTDNNDDATCTTTEETTYTVATGSQQSTKTSLSTINGTAAQLGGNSYNNYYSKTDNNNIKDYTDMSSDLAADGDFIVRASHEYHTDSDGHLSFTQFQYIKVRHCDASGWWFGESENNRGWFPSNRVERVTDVYESEVRKTQLCKHLFFVSNEMKRKAMDDILMSFLPFFPLLALFFCPFGHSFTHKQYLSRPTSVSAHLVECKKKS